MVVHIISSNAGGVNSPSVSRPFFRIPREIFNENTYHMHYFTHLSLSPEKFRICRAIFEKVICVEYEKLIPKQLLNNSKTPSSIRMKKFETICIFLRISCRIRISGDASRILNSASRNKYSRTEVKLFK